MTEHFWVGGRKFVPEAVTPGALPTGKTFYRVLHEAELASNLRSTPARMPEVRPLFPNHHAPFEKYWQLLSWKMNPLLSAGNMTAVYNWQLWIANNQGFGMSADPRANYFENKNLSFSFPRVEALTCGGSLLSIIGEFEGKWIVETLDWHNPAPTLEWIQARPWFITEAVKLNGDGLPARFPQGQQPNGYQPGVRHMLLADPRRFDGQSGRTPITIQKWRVVRWTNPNPPDPYKVY